MAKQETLIEQSMRHLRDIRDITLRQIEMMRKYPDFKEDVAKIEAMLKETDQILARAEKVK